MMLLAMPCLDLCVDVCISMLYGQILIFTCLYAWIQVLPCLCAKLVHVDVYVSMPTCLDLCFHMLYTVFHVLMRSMPCLCTQTQAMFVMPCAIVALLFLLSHFFLCFGLMVRTRSRLYGHCHHPYTKAHIKRVRIIPICMSMLACFYVLCLCQPLLFQALLCLAPSAGLTLCGYIRHP